MQITNALVATVCDLGVHFPFGLQVANGKTMGQSGNAGEHVQRNLH